MIALEQNGKLIYQGSWTLALQKLVGLEGNSQPKLPCVTKHGTLRSINYKRANLLAYQKPGAETGALNGDAWEVTIAAKNVELADAKSQALTQIAENRYNAETGGVVLNSKFYSTDRHSQAAIANLTGTVNYKCSMTVKRDIEQPDGKLVETVCVGTPVFANTDMAELQKAVSDHVKLCFENEAKLMKDIAAASNVTALRSINLTSGYPSPPPQDPG